MSSSVSNSPVAGANAMTGTAGAPQPAPAAGGPVPAKAPLFSAAAWAPLKVELFRSLWIATSVAQIGTWVREAAGPTLMESLVSAKGADPSQWVARVLVFSNLPIMLLSVFAGALADVLDRRRLLIVTQIWMILASASLGFLTLAGMVTPGMLLVMTFLLGVGTAAFGPALQAVLPELVPKPQFALAINLNSIALNVARAVGPALFIVVVLFVPGDNGAGVAFLLTAASFVSAVWVLWRWKRPAQRAAVAGESLFNGIRAGFLYTAYSRANRAILLRVFTFIVPAVVIWSQVPIIAIGQLGIGQDKTAAAAVSSSAGGPSAGPAAATLPTTSPAASARPSTEPPTQPTATAAATSTKPSVGKAQMIQQVSAMLYAFVGLGAVLGVLLMPGLHGRFNIDPVVNVCTLFFALGLIALSFVHTLWLAAIILIFMGVNWVIIPTNFNTATQKSVPIWVKGRAISFYLTVLFGSFAIGGALWGAVTKAYSPADRPGQGIGMSLLIGGIAMAAALVLAKRYPLTINEGIDLSPAYPPGTPGPNFPGIDRLPTSGNVELTRRYTFDPSQEHTFRKLMREVHQLRRRSGASGWRLHRGKVWTETVVYRSKAEFDRHLSRLTKSDLKLEEQATRYLAVSDPNPVSVRGENLWL